MDYKEYMQDYLKGDNKRINHILNVRKRALELGKIYNADLDVLDTAAILHDLTKNKSKEFHLTKIKDINFINSTPEQLWHAKSAMVVAKELGVTNDNILEAIEYHIYGKINMSIETLILVIADYTEEGRTHKYAKEVYEIALEDLNKAYLLMTEKTIIHLKQMNQPIANEQFEVYNYIKRRISDK